MERKLKMIFESVVKQDDVFHRFVEEEIFDRSKVFLKDEEFSDEKSDVFS